MLYDNMATLTTVTVHQCWQQLISDQWTSKKKKPVYIKSYELSLVAFLQTLKTGIFMTGDSVLHTVPSPMEHMHINIFKICIQHAALYRVPALT
jgi:hypothetical protein